jgi:hypothetical protein
MIVIDNRKQRLKARRVHAPIIDPILHPNHANYNQQQQYNSFNLHEMNESEATAVDPALQMNIKKLTTSLQQVLCSTTTAPSGGMRPNA